MKERKKFKSFDEYASSLPVKVRSNLTVLKDIILEIAPEATQTMFYNVPAFEISKRGKKIDRIIMIAGFKNHVGLYPHPTTIEQFQDELKAFKSGKGSIQFPLDQPLPKDLIHKMVIYRKALTDKE